MKKIAVVFGGASVEHDVSIITGLQAINNLKTVFDIIPIYLSLDNKFFLVKSLLPKDYINKNYIIKNSPEIKFIDGAIYKYKKRHLKSFMSIDGVINCCHGGIGENGVLSAYFELNGICNTSANAFASSLCMNKFATKQMIKSLDIPTINGVVVTRENENVIIEKIKKEFSNNLIIKPNTLGSSIGIIKSNKKQLKHNIDMVLHLDNEIIVEECIQHMDELNCAVIKCNGELCVSQIEKVSSGNDILTFEDKYCDKKSIRELPAQIEDKLRNKVYEYSKQIYSLFHLTGVVRIDFIYDKSNDVLYANEINTIPGSLAFYLFEGLGLDYIMLCNTMLENTYEIKNQTYFESDILTKTGFKIK